MKKITLSCLFLYAATCFAQTFYQKFPTALDLDYDVGAVEIGSGYIMGDNEVNSANNFHGVIRISRTDYSGNITWTKKYDAGSGTSVHLYQLVSTSDGYVLVVGYAGPDNNSVASQRFVMKLDISGNVMWSKQYASLLAYNRSTIVPLSNTSYVFSLGAFSDGKPVLCRIDSSGNVLSASKFNIILSNIDNIVLYNNSLDIILSTLYVLNTDVTGSVINWQRQYDNSQQFNSLISNRCANGDLIYMAGQITGGSGDGTSRIFRTDSSGNLEWSKNILAWQGPVSSLFTNFDAVTHIAISESANGNIVGVSLDEGGTLLFSVFDSAGNYLYNRNRIAVGQQHCVTETASGNYLVGSVFAFQSFSTFSSYPISPASSCDSVLNVSITTGVDSAANLAPVTVSTDTVTSTDVTLTISSISITPIIYCTPTVGVAETEMTQPGFSIYPNPASSTLHLNLGNVQTAQIKIINLTGEELLRKRIHSGDNTIDISEINDGIYFAVITSDKQSNARKLVVLRK